MTNYDNHIYICICNYICTYIRQYNTDTLQIAVTIVSVNI